MRRKVSSTDTTQPSLPTLSLPPLPSDDFPVIPGHNKTLAVLPFRNLSDQTDKTLSLRLLEDLIGHLAEFKSVTVRPSSYVLKYLDKEVNPVEVGHSLGVDAVMMGSLLGTETKLRAMAQIIEADTGSILWSGTIDASDSNTLRLLDAISERLITQLSGKQHTSSPYDMLGDEHEEVRLNAISTLKYSFEPQALEALADALSDKSVRVKASAAEALSRFERLAAPAVTARLEESLHHKDFDTARFAARASGLLGTAETVPTLLEALACEDSLTASEAALALGRLRDNRAQHELIEALGRSDASVRFTSAQALGEIGDPKSLDALAKRMLEDVDEGVRAKAFWAIKHIQKSNK